MISLTLNLDRTLANFTNKLSLLALDDQMPKLLNVFVFVASLYIVVQLLMTIWYSSHDFIYHFIFKQVSPAYGLTHEEH